MALGSWCLSARPSATFLDPKWLPRETATVTNETQRRYHFSGVGGSGMAPLAILTASRGALVTGSDRNHDRGLALPVFDALRAAGVRLVPQDGSGITPDLTAFVHSTAVETGNPDFQRAVELGVACIRR